MSRNVRIRLLECWDPGIQDPFPFPSLLLGAIFHSLRVEDPSCPPCQSAKYSRSELQVGLEMLLLENLFVLGHYKFTAR